MSAMQLITHSHPGYLAMLESGASRHNGAYYYSREIAGIMMHMVETDRPWVTIHVPGRCFDRAIFFVHNNAHPEIYGWLDRYEDLVLVCGVEETCEKVSNLGTAIYLPLSVDTGYVSSFARPKCRDACYVGRRGKRVGEVGKVSLPEGVDLLEDMPRTQLLERLATYRRAYAVGRCAIEARVLGCEVLPYDPRYPDPSVWEVHDTRWAAGELQRKLDEIGG